MEPRPGVRLPVSEHHTSAMFYLVIVRGIPWLEAQEKIAEAHRLTISHWARLGSRSWRQFEAALLSLSEG